MAPEHLQGQNDRFLESVRLSLEMEDMDSCIVAG